MKDDYTPEVGDRVVITKSKNNWAYEMDKFDGQVHTIGKVFDTDTRSTSVSFKGDLEEDGINKWAWIYADGHYKFLDREKKPLKVKLKF